MIWGLTLPNVTLGCKDTMKQGLGFCFDAKVSGPVLETCSRLVLGCLGVGRVLSDSFVAAISFLLCWFKTPGSLASCQGQLEDRLQRCRLSTARPCVQKPAEGQWQLCANAHCTHMVHTYTGTHPHTMRTHIQENDEHGHASTHWTYTHVCLQTHRYACTPARAHIQHTRTRREGHWWQTQTRTWKQETGAIRG